MPFQGNPRRAPRFLPWRWRSALDLGADGIATTLKHAKTPRRLTPSRRLEMEYEVLTLHTDDGVRLDAWWVPGAAKATDDGLVAVLHHHYGGQKATLLPWIHLLHRLGITSLSFDARGHAGSDATPPGRGSFLKRTADVRAALTEVRRRGARRILGVGQSQGGAVLAMALGQERAADLAGLILDSGPAPDMATAAWGLAGNLLGTDKNDRLARTLLAARIVPGTEPLRYPFALWSALWRLRAVPLLWIHGDRDDVIERRWAEAWFRALRSSRGPWQELLVPGADHVRTLATAPRVVGDAVQDFVTRCGR